MKQDTLRDIRTYYSDLGGCLRVMLSEKLKSGCIAWNYIITILRTPYIGESNLADQLEEKYCPCKCLLMQLCSTLLHLKCCSSINNYKLSIDTMLECKNVHKQHEYEVLMPYKI